MDTQKHSTRRIQTLGKVLGHQAIEGGVELKAENGIAELTVWAAGTVRVRIRRHNEDWEPFSYAVVGEPVDVEFRVEAGEDGLRLEVPQLVVEIQLAPFALRFLTHEGAVLSEDDPSFGVHWNGTEVAHYRKLQRGERFIGLGEKTGPLDRAGAAYVNWNTDNFGYGVDADPLYMSTPFFMGIVNQHVYGYFLDNSFKTVFNFGASTDRYSWSSAESGILDYYFFHGPGVPSILKAYTDLTGRMELPPLWSLGYQQCRYSYYPDKEVLSVARTFREKRIPVDVIYLDIHYMDEYKVFTWHPERFPDPAAMCAALGEMGFKVALIVDPGVKVEEGYATYESGLDAGIFVTYPDGKPYQGQVWPGWSHFPDFTTEKGRAWWASQFRAYTEMGVQGFWNDMNEPAAWGQHLPNAVEFGWEGQATTHKQARNVYGMQMARATLAGVKAGMGKKRPFLLNRAGFSGVQRYTATWTGDNVATDAHMLAGVRLVNSLGLTGVPFAGFDVGGFVGEASPALYARWMAIGAFTPFYRGHTMINTRDSEPWAYGEEVEDISRNYIGLRYQLLPYLYSAFEEATRTGMPVARSLAIDYPFYDEVYSPLHHNQYLFGSSLLVAPAESTRDLIKVWMPPGLWYDFLTGNSYTGPQQVIVEQSMDKLPVFVKAGAVVPAQACVQHVGAAHDGILRMHVYGGGEDIFASTFYEDDGTTSAFQGGAYSRRQVFHNAADRTLHLEVAEGNYGSGYTQLQFIWHGVQVEQVLVNGLVVNGVRMDHRWMEPVSKFDPFTKAGNEYAEKGLFSVTVPYVQDVISVQY